ncbi:MAG: radical SAM protein [Erysipelotrichaceae bacterium]|nr:radical SAM protein [Erysipelotrichaceae bacterium]
MEFIKTKTILSKVSYGEQWFGVDYNMNLYRGCPHGCIYCDSRSECYGIDDYDQPRGKENALFLLEQELRKKRNKGVIGLGSMSDTYNPLEKQYEQTRGALKLIRDYGFGVAIDTKSELILRDTDLLKEINERNNVIIKITITTPHDELAEIIEPHVCVSLKRFSAIKELSGNGIFTGILLMPVLPFITDQEEDIRLLVRKAAEHGARFIYTYMSMTLRDRQREYYYQKLDEHFLGLKEKYQRYYGNRYDCTVLKHERLWKAFMEECERYGILYRMKDIIKAYKDNKTDEQLSLF